MKQNRMKQNGMKQNETKQNKTKQNETKQNITRTEQKELNETEQFIIKQNRNMYISKDGPSFLQGMIVHSWERTERTILKMYEHSQP